MSNFLIREKLSLEDAFFLKEDQILIDKMKQMEKMKKTKEEYTKVSGITNDTVLQKFIELDLEVNLVASMALVPLIEVAWADGKITTEERVVILSCIEKLGVDNKGIELSLIERWLTHRPEPKLLDAWFSYVHGVNERMSPEERKVFEEVLMHDVTRVANASVGKWSFNFGLGKKFSKREKRVIEKLRSAFR
ncbi:MAG: TerB family tellurite resistance protein [Oligoflexia bacterium]|nr:TerB family tellurite resistance protein [Oligoflexia bacterium]